MSNLGNKNLIKMENKRDTLETTFLILRIVVLVKAIILIFMGIIMLIKNDVYSKYIENNKSTGFLYKKHDEKINSTVYGIDLAKYRVKDLKNISSKDNISFVYIKATDGLNYENPEFNNEWEIAKEKKLLCGAYHFFRNNDDPIEQADFFYKTIESVYSNSVLPAVIDIEGASLELNPYNIQGNALVFINHLELLINKRPMIYTNYYFGEEHLTDSTFANFPLWIADYSSSKSPRVPKVWQKKGWSVWQKTDKYKGDIDLDIIRDSSLIDSR